MKKNIKNKKHYSSPLVEEVIIDQMVSMNGMSTEPPGEFPKVASPSTSQDNPIQQTPPSSENDPFGGNTVSY